jgi:hypothetical protein
LFVIAGVLVVWFTKAVIGVSGDAVLVAELVLPAVVYLVFSGQIAEVSAGSITAKLRQIGSRKVDVAYAAIEASADLVEKGSVRGLEDKLRGLSGKRLPVALTITVRGPRPRSGAGSRSVRRRSYDPRAILAYLDALASRQQFRLVIFVDPGRRLIGYVSGHELLELLRSILPSQPPTGLREERRREVHQLVDALNEGDVERVRALPGLASATVNVSSSNAEALAAMVDAGLETMVVVDDDGVVRGLIERARIGDEMLLGLVRSETDQSR